MSCFDCLGRECYLLVNPWVRVLRQTVPDAPDTWTASPTKHDWLFHMSPEAVGCVLTELPLASHGMQSHK